MATVTPDRRLAGTTGFIAFAMDSNAPVENSSGGIKENAAPELSLANFL